MKTANDNRFFTIFFVLVYDCCDEKTGLKTYLYDTSCKTILTCRLSVSTTARYNLLRAYVGAKFEL